MHKLKDEISRWNFNKFSNNDWEKKIENEIKDIPFVQTPAPPFFYTQTDINTLGIADFTISNPKSSDNRDIFSGSSIHMDKLEKSYEELSQLLAEGNNLIYVKIGDLSYNYIQLSGLMRIFVGRNTRMTLDLRQQSKDVIFEKINSEFLEALSSQNFTGSIFLPEELLKDLLLFTSAEFLNLSTCHLLHLNCENKTIGEIVAWGVNLLRLYFPIVGDKIFKHFEFNFKIGNNFFEEISKARAFSFLWQKIQYIYLEGVNHPIQMNAILTTRSQKEVEYKDVLEVTSRCLSAFIGGYKSMLISDEVLTGPAALLRALRNVPLILSEESNFKNVYDAAEGSYYIEKTTHQLAREGWDQFMAIEKEGGYFKYKDKHGK